MQRQPQDDEDGKDRNGSIERRILFEGRKPVIIDRHDPGQAYPRLKIIGQMQILGGLCDRICRRASRLG